MTPDLWRKYSEWPLAAAAVVFLVTYSIQVIANVPERDALVYEIIIWATWGPVRRRLRRQPDPGRAPVALVHAQPARRGDPGAADAAPVAPDPAGLGHAVLAPGGRTTTARTVLTYAFAIAVLLVYVGALAALDAEQNVRGASITNIGDALWWAAVTLTGTGYGDFVPITLVGRLVGVGLMIGGLAIVGVIAASFAAWMIERVGTRVAEDAERVEFDVRVELERVSGQLDRVTAMLEAGGGRQEQP
jgi:Ion channel.